MTSDIAADVATVTALALGLLPFSVLAWLGVFFYLAKKRRK